MVPSVDEGPLVRPGQVRAPEPVLSCWPCRGWGWGWEQGCSGHSFRKERRAPPGRLVQTSWGVVLLSPQAKRTLPQLVPQGDRSPWAWLREPLSSSVHPVPPAASQSQQVSRFTCMTSPSAQGP